MTSTTLLLILIGLFIIINAPNLVGVIQGNKVISQTATAKSSTADTTTTGDTRVVGRSTSAKAS